MQTRSRQQLASQLHSLSSQHKLHSTSPNSINQPTLINSSQVPSSPSNSVMMSFSQYGMWHHAGAIMKMHRNKEVREGEGRAEVSKRLETEEGKRKGKSGYKITHRSQRNTANVLKNDTQLTDSCGKGQENGKDNIATGKEKPPVRCWGNQQYLKQRQQHVNRLTRQLSQTAHKLRQQQKKNALLSQKLSKHTNDVHLLLSMTQKLRYPSSRMVQQGAMISTDSEDRQLARQAAELNKWLTNDSKQKENQYSKHTYKLQCQLVAVNQEMDRMRQEVAMRDMKIERLEKQIDAVEIDTSLHQRLLMCQEELQTYRLKYYEKRGQLSTLHEKAQSMREKLKAMTSLIGCAIIFDMNQKDRDKMAFRQFMNKLNQHQCLTHNILDTAFNDAQIQEYLKRNKNSSNNSNHTASYEEQEIQQMQKTTHYKPLYYPNYLALIGQDSITPSNQTATISPSLFIRLRSILDSKYIDYRIHGCHAAPFSNFVSSHIKHYHIHENNKNMHLMTRQPSEAEIKMGHIDFFQQLLEHRIMDLPEIEVFREFLMSRYQQDEIMFYLICRHKFLQGSELQNFINCGDPSKLIAYNGPQKRLLAKITSRFGRSVQNYVCWHINERTITKGGNVFIRIYYLLKILLSVYRRSRQRQVAEFKTIFQSQYCLSEVVPFFQFTQILKKNFDYISRMQICQYYKHTSAVYQSQKSKHSKTSFFQCFVACCMSGLLLEELLRYDKQLEGECFLDQKISELKDSGSPPEISKNLGHMTQGRKIAEKKGGKHAKKQSVDWKDSEVSDLWPNAVYSLGNQQLNLTYTELLSTPHTTLRRHTQTLSFLSTLVGCHLIREQQHLPFSSDLQSLLSSTNGQLIEYLNSVQKARVQRQKQVNMASGKIGRFFKNKTYEFYNQMLQDINSASKQAKIQKNASGMSQRRTNGKYMKQKVRVSKLLLASSRNSATSNELIMTTPI